jgi:hypothetical protein
MNQRDAKASKRFTTKLFILMLCWGKSKICQKAISSKQGIEMLAKSF